MLFDILRLTNVCDINNVTNRVNNPATTISEPMYKNKLLN